METESQWMTRMIRETMERTIKVVTAHPSSPINPGVLAGMMETVNGYAADLAALADKGE